MDPAHAKALELFKDLGEVILQDDIDDLYRFSFPGHPSPFHHWQIGLAMKGAAEMIRWGVALSELERFLGAPVGDVERLQAQLYAITAI